VEQPNSPKATKFGHSTLVRKLPQPVRKNHWDCRHRARARRLDLRPAKLPK